MGIISVFPLFVKAQGFLDFSSHFCVRKMMEGWDKEHQKEPDKHSPISPLMLKQVSAAWLLVCRNAYEVSLFKATTLIAFFGAFRISEPVVASRGNIAKIA